MAQEPTEQRTEPEIQDVEEVDEAAALRAERDDYLDRLQRLKAEFDNYRKRAARDQESFAARANEALVKELLPILDDLERALDAAEHHEEAKLEDGVRLIHQAFSQTLRKQGLEEIETSGRFDPHVHESLLSQPSDADEGSVIEVVQKGYRLGDRVLRPARVVIAGAKESNGDRNG
jgi:molecular chaperone GrpE